MMLLNCITRPRFSLVGSIWLWCWTVCRLSSFTAVRSEKHFHCTKEPIMLTLHLPFIVLWGGDFLYMTTPWFKKECVCVHVLGSYKLVICDIFTVPFQLLTASCVVTWGETIFNCPNRKVGKRRMFFFWWLCIKLFVWSVIMLEDLNGEFVLCVLL